MIRISAKERRKAGNIYCPYCKPQKVNAVWRITGWYDKSKHVACDTHKVHLVDHDYDPDYNTDADYQTWLLWKGR